MRSVGTSAICVLMLAAGAVYWLGRQPHEWPGVDETIVEKSAEEAGRPARDPYINTDQGDLLLFFFLIAGATGGFLAGYCFRELFPPKSVTNP